MASVIDELVVILGLDASQFTDAQKKAIADLKRTKEDAAAYAKEMKASGKVAAEFYGQIKSEALSLIAVLVGANSIEKFVAGTVTTLADVGRIATVMGQATPDVIAVGMAVARINGNAKEAQSSMLALSQTMERWALFGEAPKNFRRGAGFVGISVNDTPLQVLQKFATWSQGKNPKLVETIGGDLGLNQDLIYETIRGRKQFDADIATSYKNAPSQGDIQEAQNLQGAFAHLGQAMGGFARRILFAADKAWDLAGALNKIADNITNTPLWPTRSGYDDPMQDVRQTYSRSISTAGRLHEDVTDAMAQSQKYAAKAAKETGGAKAGDEYRAAHYRNIAHMAAIQEQHFAQAAVSAATKWRSLSPATAPEDSAGAAAQRGDVQQLLAAGFTREQARGILAGIKAEGGDPNILNATATHGAFIGQWRGPRLAALRAKYGNHPTRAQQMAFLIDEMTNPTNPEYQAERKAGFMGFANDTTAEATMRDYLTSVMRPAAGLAGDLSRGAQALTEINIDTINVNAPNATNAKDIAKGIHKALASQIATQANSGPS